jgi:hypothetical protein
VFLTGTASQELQERATQPLTVRRAFVGGATCRVRSRVAGLVLGANRGSPKPASRLVHDRAPQVGARIVDAVALPPRVHEGERVGDELLGLSLVTRQEIREAEGRPLMGADYIGEVRGCLLLWPQRLQRLQLHTHIDATVS